jgi:hypothetical protein
MGHCAQKYAAAAFAFYEQFPYPSKGWYAADQFYRASSSATSNYCAAKRGRSTAEFIGTARRNEKARQQRLKDARAKRRCEKQSKPRRYPDPT